MSQGATTKLRIELIKAIAVQTFQELHSKAESCYSDLNDWLGAQFLQEMNRSTSTADLIAVLFHSHYMLLQE